MRILSDFDGVWTDQAAEARAILESFARHAAPHVARTADDALADADAFLDAARARPAHNGWRPGPCITAFVDEDPALATGSIARWLDDREDGSGPLSDAATRWRRGLAAAGWPTVEAFSSEHFAPAMERFRADHGHRLVPGAAEAAARLEGAGVELVVVSNSPRAKLVEMFAAEGLHETPLRRFVGDARKWQVGDPGVTREVLGRSVPVDRPHYAGIIARVAPDAIVGDVVSFDLAAAASLAPAHRRPRRLLRRHPHTPRWALDQAALPEHERLVDAVVDGVADLAEAAGGDGPVTARRSGRPPR